MRTKVTGGGAGAHLPNGTDEVADDVGAGGQAHEFALVRELHHRALLDALPAAIYTTDANGRITFYNEACVALSGRRPVIGTDEWCVSWKLYWPDGTPLPHDQCPMAIALKDGRPIRGAEAVAERPDGSRITFAAFPTPLYDADGKLVGAVNMLVDISHRKQAEEQLDLLAREVNHRANNLLSTVHAMVRLTRGDSVEALKAALEGRIGALAHAHNLLAKSRWSGADLQQLVQEEVAPYLGGLTSRVSMSGPRLPLEPQAAQSLAMAIHELTTNAVKYGALSNDTGRVEVSWSIKGNRLRLQWRETGGPATSRPVKRGVGTTVISRSVRYLGGEVEFDWRAEGLVCRLAGTVLTPGRR